MSATSKNSKKNKSKKAIDRPYTKAVLAKATKLANQYQVILKHDPDKPGSWIGRGVEMPQVRGDGKTPQACVKNTLEAFIAVLGYMIEQQEVLPTPASQERRTEHATIRLSINEKMLFEADARRKGYADISDYLRRLGIEAATG